MIPTRAKDKIPQSLTYPLKAKAISESLADVPQMDEFELSFSNRYTPTKLRALTKFTLVEVWYYFWEANRFMPPRPHEGRGRWTITVYAAPVEIRARVTQLLSEEGLPKIRAWLQSKADVSAQRSCRIQVSFNEAEDELECFQRET